jgi:hypothetical protein
MNWSQRRRMYNLGILNKKFSYPETMKGWLAVIGEKTLGFSKQSDKISISQFQEILGLSESQIKRWRRAAIKCNLILAKAGDGRGNLTEYFPQEDQTKWLQYTVETRKEKGSPKENPFNNAQRGSSKGIKGVTKKHKGGHLDAKRGSPRVAPTVITDVTGFTGEEQEPNNAHPSDMLSSNPSGSLDSILEETTPNAENETPDKCAVAGVDDDAQAEWEAKWFKSDECKNFLAVILQTKLLFKPSLQEVHEIINSLVDKKHYSLETLHDTWLIEWSRTGMWEKLQSCQDVIDST